MSRLENHAMLRDAATDVYNLQYALLEKYGLAAIEGSVFAQHLKEESSGLILLSNFKQLH